MASAAPEYVVLSNGEPDAIATDLRPERCAYPDFYVLSKNMAWTMVFTYEDDCLGPYFAKHPDCNALNAKNITRIRKNKDIEEARLKG